MKNIPPEILARFDDILKLREVSLFSRPEYRKWVRYFVDFPGDAGPCRCKDDDDLYPLRAEQDGEGKKEPAGFLMSA